MSEFLEKISKLSPQRLALLADELNRRLESAKQQRHVPLAIVGMGCRLPGGVSSPEDFWELLRDGRDAIEEVPHLRWNVDEVYDDTPDAPGKTNTRWGGFIDGPELFDPKFFGIAPTEASNMDPQQRLLLEISWEALENAGIAPNRLGGTRTGVFAGICNGDYAHLALTLPRELISSHFALGLSHAVAAGRISYLLGLKGPSLAVDTSCSASLVAVHLACQSLRLGECDMALAGGVNLILNQDITIALSQSRMMSPDGHCKAFSESANGFVRSEGCGIVVLKRLPDAIENRDRILAVIRGSACNQDGRSSGLTAPNGPSQEEAIRTALADAAMEPDEVDYVEAHGTGTSLGDPIEAGALNEVFASRAGKSDPLYVGSVKTNLGHLESAAGIAGLMKLVLSIYHGEIPASLHLGEPSRHIDWGRLPLEVPTHHRTWRRRGKTRVGAVSSFGFSGTNAHVVVEEFLSVAPEIGSEGEDRSYLFPLSAKTPAALRAVAQRLARHLTEHPEIPLAGVARTLADGRAHFGHRAAIVTSSREELIDQLDEIANHDAELRTEPKQQGNVNPDSRRAVLEAAAQRYRLDGSLEVPEIFSERAETVSLPTYPFERERYWLPEIRRERPETSVGPYSKPVVGASVEKRSPAEDWVYELSWEPKPLAQEGSLDAGPKLDLEWLDRVAVTPATPKLVNVDRLAAKMARLYPPIIFRALQGAGLDSAAGEFTLDSLKAELQIAPARSRPFGRLIAMLEEDGFIARSGGAFRWNRVLEEPDVDEQLASLRREFPNHRAELGLLGRCAKNLAAVLQGTCDPVGLLFTAGEAEAVYRDSPVGRFFNEKAATAVRAAVESVSGRTVRILEIGAGTGATTQSILKSLEGTNADVEYVFTDVSKGFLSRGQEKFSRAEFMDFKLLDIESEPAAQGFALGTYDVVLAANVLHATADLRRTIAHVRSLLRPSGALFLIEGVRPDRWLDLTFGLTDGWWRFKDLDLRPDSLIVSAETWSKLLQEAGMEVCRTVSYRSEDGSLSQQALIVSQASQEEGHVAKPTQPAMPPREWIILADRSGVGEALAGKLVGYGQTCRLIPKPASTAALADALDRLREPELADTVPGRETPEIVYLWGLDAAEPDAAGAPPLTGVELCGKALVSTIQAALKRTDYAGNAGFWIVTRGAQATESYMPGVEGAVQALAWGIGRTFRLESPERFRGLIDLDPASTSDQAADDLIRELQARESTCEKAFSTMVEDQVAFRGAARLAPRLRHAPLVQPERNLPAFSGLRRDGSYLLVGGLGGVGLRVARWAAEQHAGHLVLLGRTGTGANAGAFAAERLEAIEEIRRLGSVVTVVEGDVASAEDMKALFARFDRDLPPLCGIVHAATVVHAAPIEKLTAEEIETMFHSKVAGLWRLHELTKDRHLDFFLIFSSMTALIGARGSAHYGAANQFADAFAYMRRGAGLPALSVNWGRWDILRLVSNSEQEAFHNIGLETMPSREALATLGDLTVSRREQVAIANVNWKVLKPLLERNRAGGFLEHVGSERSNTGRNSRSIPGHADLRVALEMHPEERKEFIEAFVADQAGHVLGFRNGELPPIDVPLTDLGLDSLMAVDLRNRLQTGLGQELPPMIVFDYPAVSEMANVLDTMLWTTSGENGGSVERKEEIRI